MANKWSDFLKDITKGVNLDLDTENSAFADILVKVSSLIYPPMLLEIEKMLKNQSLANYLNMSDEEMDRLMANKMVGRIQGAKSKGQIRMYFEEPFDINIPETMSITDKNGSTFFPQRSVSLSYDQMNLQMEGRFFYVDVDVESESEGEVYNIGRDFIESVDIDFPHFVRVTNRFPIVGGINRESNYDLMMKGVVSQSVRDFACKWGINTLIRAKFPQVVEVRVVGAGEEGMDRDKVFGLHSHGKADVYVKTITPTQKSRILPAGTSVVQFSSLPEDAGEMESQTIINDIPILSVDNIYLRDIADINERTGVELRIAGGYGMGGYGYGVYGQGGMQLLNREKIQEGERVGIVLTTSGKATFEKFSRVVTGTNTNWRDNVHRGDRIQRTRDVGKGYTKDFGRMYTVAEVISDTKILLSNQYEEDGAVDVNYRIQSYLYNSEVPSTLHYVSRFDGTSTKDIRYSSKEFSFLRIGRDYIKYPVEVVYTTDPIIKEIQAFCDEHLNKIAGFDILVKHFVPVYVDMDIEYEGGPDEERMVDLLETVINEDKIFDPELDRIRKLSNWDGEKWLVDVSDIVDLFHNSGCTYVKIPLKIKITKHYPSGAAFTEDNPESYIELEPFHHLISRDITLRQKKITERRKKK